MTKAEQLSRWTLTQTKPDCWQLVNPANREQVAYRYTYRDEKGRRMRRVGATAQVGALVTGFVPLGTFKTIQAAREAAEVDVLLEAFRLAIAATQSPAQERRAA